MHWLLGRIDTQQSTATLSTVFIMIVITILLSGMQDLMSGTKVACTSTFQLGQILFYAKSGVLGCTHHDV